MKILSLLIFIFLTLSANIGSVGAYRGSAKLIRQGESLDISSGMILKQHDTIVTKTETKVQLIMKDETIITIGPSSYFKIDSYSFENSKKNTLNVQLKHGFFRAITGKIGKIAPERFKIRTKSATIGIRGTDFGAYVGEQSEYIGCFNGKIDVLTKDKTFEVDKSMMVMLEDNIWKKIALDIDKFRAVLHPAIIQNSAKEKIVNPFDSSTIEALTQQERLQNSNVEITPGYNVNTLPPPFVP
jgi:hypothetical protein